MSYAANKKIPGIRSNHFLILKPRARLTGTWTNAGGNVWQISVSDFPEILKFSRDAVNFEKVDVAPTVTETYRHNADLIFIYSVANPNSDLKISVLQYPIYLGTETAYLWKKPTDDSTETVLFEGYIHSVPTAKSSMTDTLSGTLSIQSSRIQLINSDGKFLKLAYEQSLNQTEFEVYHYLGELKTRELDESNAKLVFSGFCFDLKCQDDYLEIRVTDKFGIFDKSFDGTYTKTGLQVGQSLPTIYGICDGVRLVPKTAVANFGVTEWWVCKNHYPRGIIGHNYHTNFVAGSGTNTTIKTFCGYDDGVLEVGDRVIIFETYDWNMFSGYFFTGTPKFVEITEIGGSGSGKFISHTSIGTPVAAGSFLAYARVTRRLAVIMDGVIYELYPRLHFDEEYAGTETYITLNAGFITGLGMPRYPDEADTLFARVHGETFSLIDCVKSLMSQAGIDVDGDEVDQDSFDALQADAEFEDVTICLSVPEKYDSQFPSIREVLGRVLGTGLLRLFINAENKWTLQKLVPLTSPTSEITDYDIAEESIEFTFEYKDIVSDVIVEYNARDISDDSAQYDGKPRTVYAVSKIAKALHGIVRQRTFQCIFRYTINAQNLAAKLSWIFGDRRGFIKLTTSFEFIESEMNQQVEITRDRVPGFELSNGVEHSRNGSIVDIDVSSKNVTLTLDDQKGFDGQGL